MPEIGYLVLSDKFFIATYVLLFLTLAQTFMSFILDSNGKQAAALRLDLAARWLFPVLVGAIFAGFMAGV